MSLYHLLRQRAAAARPVRVGQIGAGKFGSMFLSEVPTTAGIEASHTTLRCCAIPLRAKSCAGPTQRRPRAPQ